jgi:TRAP-type C4-dicarboxylate transport system permease small subunit
LLITTIAGGVYLSDTQGVIEPAPTGPFDILSLILGRIAMIAVAVIVLVMFYEVVARYVFSKPTLWANELSLWIAAFVFILAGLYAMQQRSHIRIYVIYDLMPRWAKKLSDIITVVLIWGFWAALVWGGYNEARDKLLRMETFGTAWDPPIPATVKVTMLIVIGLVALQALSNLIADWNKEPHRGGTDEIDEHEIEQLKHALGTDKNG